jgi:2-amino-4-hydroxy-6-hydroxymethyldihydropteridine diphosphokinase
VAGQGERDGTGFIQTDSEHGPGGWRYLIALGSNIRHHRHGDPRGVLRAALAILDSGDVVVEARSPIMDSMPMGPSLRRYANGAALLRTALPPPMLLRQLKAIEQQFGRRRGQRWGARVLDLDLVLWDGGCWRSPGLILPHPAFRQRSFVLGPATRLAPVWRDPITNLTLRQLYARLTRRPPLPRAPHGEGP